LTLSFSIAYICHGGDAGGNDMKVGYPQAAWRLFQVTLTPLRWPTKVTWADTELEGTPFQSTRLPLPVVRPKGTH
jgi:hypothetical protein